MKKLYMFSAVWCQPCKAAKPAFNAAQKTATDVEFEIIDVDKNSDLALKYNIRSVPTYVLTQNDAEVARTVGGMTEEKIKNFLNS